MHRMKDFLKGAVIFGLFLVPFLTLYVENDFFFPYITGKNFAFRIIVEITLALYAVLALLEPQYRPRFSWILASFTGLIAVMGVATALAEHVPTAFWSNFERMDGYITLIHMYAYFVVMASVFKTGKIWTIFLNVSVAVAALVALKGLSQFAAADGMSRVDSTLGNAAYMAVYMLFHIFILLYLGLNTRVRMYQAIYVVLGLMFTFVLLQTGTRGTFIGLVVGLVTSVAYIALFASKYPQIRRYAIGSFAALVLLAGGFYAVRDSDYIQNSPSLSRIANIDVLTDLQTRSIIWGMSVEGIKERPLLGWGNGNFNYVFNAEYDPRMYGQEQWFDRVHNIFFDWLIAGGILGFLAYFSIFMALGYYLLVRPFFKHDETLTVFERAVLLGLVAGYLTHNLVVFDNIVSYIFFATILALIHARVGREVSVVQRFKMPEPLVMQAAAPVIGVAMILVVYFLNAPGIQAAGNIIDAFKVVNTNPAMALDYFKQALEADSFAQQEVTEQLAQQAMSLMGNTSISPEVRAAYAEEAERRLKLMVEAKPNDARLHVFFAGFYRAAGKFDEAKQQIEIARSLSPDKQSIILQQGAIALAVNDIAAAREYFKTAYELDTRNQEAKEFYLASLYYANDLAAADALLVDATPEFKTRLAANDFVVNAVNTAADYDFLAELYELRVAKNPASAQEWASLSFVYYQLKQNDKAIATLERAATAVPSFASTSRCIIQNLQNGREPQLNCV